MAEQPSQAVQDYLKAIHSLGGADKVVLPVDIAAHLGEPLEDPHGHPIPGRDGSLVRRDLKPLSAFRAGQRVLIREVQDDNPDRLRRWRTLGLVPGVTVLIRNYEELDDLFTVEVGGHVVPVGSEGLAGLHGELVAEEEE